MLPSSNNGSNRVDAALKLFIICTTVSVSPRQREQSAFPPEEDLLVRDHFQDDVKQIA